MLLFISTQRIEAHQSLAEIEPSQSEVLGLRAPILAGELPSVPKLFNYYITEGAENQPKVFLHIVFPNPGRPDPNPGTSWPLPV